MTTYTDMQEHVIYLGEQLAQVTADRDRLRERYLNLYSQGQAWRADSVRNVWKARCRSVRFYARALNDAIDATVAPEEES